MADKKEKKESSFRLVCGVIKYFFPAAWKFRKGYFFAMIFKTICGILKPFAAIIMTPYIIDELLGNRDTDLLIRYTAILVIGETLLSLCESLMDMLCAKYAVRFDNYFAEEMSRRVMELDFQLTEDKNALDQIEKARTGMDWYSGGLDSISSEFFSLISNGAKLLGTARIIAFKAPVLLLIIFVLMIITAIMNKKINAIEIEVFNNLSKSNRIFGYYFYDMTQFRTGKDIRLYGSEKMMIEKCDNVLGDMIDEWEREAHRIIPYNMVTTLCSIVRDVSNYLVSGLLVIMGKISIGVFSQLIAASSTLHSSMVGMVTCVQNIIKKSNYANEYIKFMKYPAVLDKGERRVGDGRHIIEFRNVSFTYPNTDVQVLKNVSITLNSGERLSVVGLNGAGKTTFIKLLCRLYDVDNGEILLDGVNIMDYDYEEYMRLFSVVFQDFKLLAFSARENVSLGRANDGSVEKYVHMAGLGDKIDSLENGLDTMIFKQFDENGIEPSGGEQQKLAISRALYKDSPIVILDEPTAALDPVAEYEIYKSFDELVGGKTAVYISHRLSSCKFCDRIAVFSDGMIKELGTHDELVGLDGGIYAEMFAAQAQYYQ